MNSQFEYNAQLVLIGSIKVEDIGNCALEAIDDRGGYYYFISYTKEGISDIVTFGPVVPDIAALPKTYKSSYSRDSYTDAKMKSAISKWIIGGKGINFISVTQIKHEEAIAQCRLATDSMSLRMSGVISDVDEEEE